MMSVCIKRFWLSLLLTGLLPCAHALTFDIKPVKLSAEQRASLKRFLDNASPNLSFDWKSLEARFNSVDRARQPLTVTLGTVPALTASGVCRSEKHHFDLEAAAARAPAHSKEHWHANDSLTQRQAWPPNGADCSDVSSPISVAKSLTDAEFLFIEREKNALRSRAAQVIGGSDCARVRYCEVTLRRINRASQENPSRILTTLTFSPAKPGPACLYVMEVSFVGPVDALVPLGASCPTL
jgi:hypothetical protein